MKSFHFLFLFSLILLCSCKKNKNNDAIISVAGFWSGAYSYGNAAPSIKMSVVFRANGTARVLYGYNGTDTANAGFRLEGSYTLQNSVLRFRYTEGSETFIHKATLTVPNSQTGTWGTAPSETDGGLYSLVLQ